MKYKLTIALIVMMSAATTLYAQSWQIGKYEVMFSNNSASGIFKTLTGTITYNPQDPSTAKFDITIDVASINTGNGLMNKHAKGKDWFDRGSYPSIKFVSTAVTKTQVTGNLTMHGVTKSISFPYTFKAAGNGGTFNGSFSVNRSDYKIGKPGGEVDEAVKLTITVPVTKK